VALIKCECILGLQSSAPQYEREWFHKFIDFPKLKLTPIAYKRPSLPQYMTAQIWMCTS